MRKVIQAVASRMIAAEDTNGVADEILQFISILPKPIKKDIRRLIFLFEYLPPLITFRASRFSALSPEDQDRYIEAWGTSRLPVLRTGFRVLKGLSVSMYYQNPSNWKAIDYQR
jgi:hypothetical protein